MPLRAFLRSAVLLFVLASWLAALGQSAHDTVLVGSWTGKIGNYDTQWNFRADGSGELLGQQFKWETPAPGVLVLIDQNGRVNYQMRVADGQITLTGRVLRAPLVLRRVGRRPMWHSG